LKPLHIALVAGEASGDLLGADLMQALKQHQPNIRFSGVGGEKMQAAGLSSAFPMERLAVMGLTEVLSRVPELFWRRGQLIKKLLADKPDVFIGIDAPEFNLGLELKLRKAGVKTAHYVSPSVWAWRQGRIKNIRKACDLMLCLFPFEQDFYCDNDVPVCFVGHPLADNLQPLDKPSARAALELPLEQPLVALMPGSRGGEVQRLGALFLDTAQRLLAEKPNLHFVLPCANTARRMQIEALLNGRKLPLTLLDGRAPLALSACDAVLIASGTATLEALLQQRPMVVAYKLSNLTYRIARRLVKSPWFALPNLLASRALVPELIQDAATPEALANQLLPLLDNPSPQTEAFAQIAKTLQQNASERAADAVLQLLGPVPVSNTAATEADFSRGKV